MNVCWFEAPNNNFKIGKFPLFLIGYGNNDEDFYGFPQIAGDIKMAIHLNGSVFQN